MTILYDDDTNYRKIWSKVCDNLNQIFVIGFSQSQYHQESITTLLQEFKSKLLTYSNEELKFLANDLCSTFGSDYNVAINIEIDSRNNNDNTTNEVDSTFIDRIGSIITNTLEGFIKSGKSWKHGARPGIAPSAEDAEKLINGAINLEKNYEKDYGNVDDILRDDGWGTLIPGLSPEDGDNESSGPGEGSGSGQGVSTPDGAGTPKMFDPLVLDLNHNGKIDTTNINSGGAYFDIDGNDDGIREHMGWVSDGDGFLVQDKNGNGKIDGIGELFGNQTINAFDDLRARMDSNGDGVIDSRDNLFDTLQVWIDKNGNGVTDDGELHSLSSLGITSINTNKTSSGDYNNGNHITFGDGFTQNGENHTAGAVDFVVDQTTATSGGQVFISDLLLPILRGYGDVKDSVVVMHENKELPLAV